VEGLVDAAAWQRLERARAGTDLPNLLRLATLAPGDVGVVEATILQVHPVRSYSRKRGGQGDLGRVTLADASGEADLVLWDDEVRHVRGGLLVPGARVRLRGASVKPGYRGGIELGVGSAVLERIDAPAATLSGTLMSLGETRVLDGPPVRFQADAVVLTAGGERSVVLEGDLLRQARSARAPVLLDGLAPHPVLVGWLLCPPSARLLPGP
jgi:hypothetical protein